jgi:hypothetical protein
MPNSWHLVLWPRADGDLSFPVQEDEHFLTVGKVPDTFFPCGCRPAVIADDLDLLFRSEIV